MEEQNQGGQPEPQTQPQPEPQSQAQPQPESAQQAAPEGQKMESGAVNNNKLMAIIGYIIPILFFIPLLSDETKNDPFAKFHAGQQLNFLIFSIAGWIIFAIASAILAMTIILIPLITLIWIAYWIACLVFMILGIIHGAKGEMKKLPIIGGYTILK